MNIDCSASSDTCPATPAMASTHADVIEWIKREFRPVPIKLREKACFEPGWPDLTVTEQDVPNLFAQETNVGVLLGPGAGDFVDVDIDAQEALPLSDRILAAAFANTLVFGRPSKRRSHYFFRAKGSKTEKFADPTRAGAGSMLVEIRAEGCQTVVPRSIHPSGELVDFELHYIDPAAVDAAELRRYVCLIAVGALLARHWPKRGSRHAASLALCGVLLRRGWEEDDVEAFVALVAEAAGDEEAPARGKNARSSASRLAAGAPVSGWPTLADYFDPRILDVIKDWLPQETAAAQVTSIECPAAVAPVGASRTAPTVDPLVFRGLAGDIVRTIEPHSEAAPVAILVQLLAGFGSIVGRGAYFRVEADEHHANLFVVLVGQSSKGRKGTSWGWVQKLLSWADPVWASDRVAGGLSSGEGLMMEVRDAVTKFDPETQEEVLVDAGVQDKRLCVVESEYASVLKVIRREGNTLSAIVRIAWDRGDLRSMTKNARLKATGTHITLIGHITGTELLRNMTETEVANGFGNRHIFVLVARSKFLPEGGSLRDEDLEPFVAKLVDAAAFARSVGLVRRDPAATARWHAVYPVLSAGEDSLVGSITARAEAQVMRLAMIYALLDKSAVTTVDHLQAALALWQYSMASCRFVFGDQLGDPIADAVLAALRKAPRGMSRTEISKLVLGGHKRSAEIATALALLEKRGLAVCERVETAGRPGEHWRAACGAPAAEVQP